MAVLATLFAGATWWLSSGTDAVIPGLVYGLIIGLLIALFMAGFGNRVYTQRLRPNQGIRTSLRNGLRLGGVGVPMLLSAVWLATLVLPDDGPLGTGGGWHAVPALTVSGFACGFFITGGYEALLHYSLRIALALQGRLPLDLVRFLDHAAQLIILTPVGGGWVFIHRLLQEHLAAQAGETPAHSGVK